MRHQPSILPRNCFFRGTVLLLVSMAGLLFSMAAQAAAGVENSPVVGTWTTLSQSQITITPCETGYCGYITKIVVPDRIREKYGDNLDALQGNYVDTLNKDPSLRQRPIQGLQILSLEAEFSQGRLNGTVYNPEDGETYEGFLEMLDFDNVRLSGCVLFNLICMGENWTRTPIELVSLE